MERFDFSVKQGESFYHVLTFKDEDGNLLDLSGHTALMQVRDRAGGDLVLDVAVEMDGAEGTLRLAVDDALTAGLDARRYVYDFFKTDENGLSVCFLEGYFDVLPAVSRVEGGV